MNQTTDSAIERAKAKLEERIQEVWEQIRGDDVPDVARLLAMGLFDVVRLSLEDLRQYLEDPDSQVDWSRPFVETVIPVDCEIAEHPDEDHPQGLVDFRWHPRQEDLVDGELPEDRLDLLVSQYFLQATLHVLTRRIVELPPTEDGRPAYILPAKLSDQLDQDSGTRRAEDGSFEGTEEALKRRAELVDELTRAYSFGEFGHEDIEDLGDAERLLDIQKRRGALSKLSFSCDVDQGERRLRGFVPVLAYPLRHDPETGESWFTLGVGLAFTEGDPRRVSKQDLDDLWETLLSPLNKHRPEGTKSAPTTRPADPRILQDSRVRMDRMAAQAVGFFGGISLWRKWDSVPAWDDLVDNEIQRIQDELGDLAFHQTQYTDTLLVRKYGQEGNASIHLTKAAKEELEERVGFRGFRRKEKDPDKVWREYLVKRVRAGGGSLTVKFSWYGGAEGLSEGARERLARKIRGDIETDERDLFGGDAEVQAIRENWLQRLGTMNDAAVLAPRLLSLMYQQRSSRVTLPAWDGYMALGIENDRDRRARLRGAIFALMHLNFIYQGKGVGKGMDGKAQGSFVLEYAEEGQRGEDSDFVVHLSEWAVGSLGVFEKARGLSKLKNPVLAFDWQAKLTTEEKKQIRYVRRFSALGSYHNRAEGLTSEQNRLMDWLEHELTLRKSGAAKGRAKVRAKKTAEDAEEPRIYQADFCPLLDPKKAYHAALGNFERNAETGRKLKGRSQGPTKSGGQRHGGLLEVMGYELPPGRATQARADVTDAALQDLRAVVEEYLGGKVAGKLGNQWIDLQGAEELETSALSERVSWFLFLPHDWNEVRRRKFEEYQQRRYEAGETDRPVRVIPPQPLSQDQVSKDPVGLNGLPLKMRLRGHRKRLRLSLEKAGKIFGLPKVRIYKWEKELDEGGQPIPEYWEPLLWRWIQDGKEPTEAELEEVKNRPKGGRK